MGRVHVIEDRCKGCGYCLKVCKQESLEISGQQRNRNGYSIAAFINGNDCNGCALCAEVCPDVAIEVYR